ncbi:FecR domain-containing protein [bacterium]|nr:FecR domain-containing protein [bacterium]MBU1073407.1 FecR domain-containing protein [bacterium]
MRRGFAWTIGASAAAMVLAAVVYVVGGTQRLSRWEVVEVRDPARIQLNRCVFRSGGLRPGQELGPTLIITERDSELALRLGGLLALRLSPDSTLDLPPPPARWIGRHRTLGVERGEVALTCGGRALGDRLVVGTEAAEIGLDGADMVVRCGAAGVDVILLRGAAELVTRDGHVHRLAGEVGMRFAGAGPPQIIPVDQRARGLVAALPDP